MYIFHRPFGDATITDPLQQLANLKVKPITASANVSYVPDIQKLQELAKTGNWTDFGTNLTGLLSNQGLTTDATTLASPLRTIKAQTQDSNKIVSEQIIKALDNILILAQNEANSTQDDRFQNEVLLSNRIEKLSKMITDFTTANSGLIAIWNKITGKEKTLYDPIIMEQNDIASEISVTPLTASGRLRLAAQFEAAQKSATSAWSLIAGSSVLFIGYVLFEFIKTRGTSAAVQWGVAKAREKAAAKAAEQAKKLHKKYFGKKKKKKP